MLTLLNFYVLCVYKQFNKVIHFCMENVKHLIKRINFQFKSFFANIWYILRTAGWLKKIFVTTSSNDREINFGIFYWKKILNFSHFRIFIRCVDSIERIISIVQLIYFISKPFLYKYTKSRFFLKLRKLMYLTRLNWRMETDWNCSGNISNVNKIDVSSHEK